MIPSWGACHKGMGGKVSLELPEINDSDTWKRVASLDIGSCWWPVEVFITFWEEDLGRKTPGRRPSRWGIAGAIRQLTAFSQGIWKEDHVYLLRFTKLFVIVPETIVAWLSRQANHQSMCRFFYQCPGAFYHSCGHDTHLLRPTISYFISYWNPGMVYRHI